MVEEEGEGVLTSGSVSSTHPLTTVLEISK